MPDRNPDPRDARIDPQPGDEWSGKPWRYRITQRGEQTVWFEMWLQWGDISSSHTVSLSCWRDMAAGLTMEKTA